MKLRAGIGILLVLALVVFALIVGVGSAALEIATITRVEVESAVNRAELAGHIVLSQLGITLRDQPRQPKQAMRSDARLASVISDAQELTPSVLYISVVDTAGQVLLHSNPVFEDRAAPVRPRLVPRHGILANLRQFSSILKETGAYEVSIPLLLNGRDFATVRIGVAAILLRADLLDVFRTHLFKILVQVMLATLLGLAVSWLVILRPLSRINKGITHLQKGDFSYRVPVSHGSEFAQLAYQINALSETLARERETMATQRETLVTEGNALRSIVDAVDDGLLMVDRKGHILMFNRTASRILGVNLGEFAGKSLNSAMTRNHPLVRLVERSFSEGRPESAQLELNVGEASHVFLASCQVLGDSPNQQGAIVSLREYGRMREIRDMLDHARVLSRLGKMAAGVAHEVRNPLNAMAIHIELIREKLRVQEQNGAIARNGLQEHLNVVSREISRLERVVYGFLKLARLQELALSPIDVSQFLNELRELVAPEGRMAGVDIVVEVQPDLPNIYGDEEVLRQAMLNLLINAIQASPAGAGPVTLRAETVDGMVQVTVQDRGQGIAPDVQNRVFDLYFTTKKGGTGVGLSLVQQAVEMHGGTITLQSGPETGTIFKILLPALTTASNAHA